MGMWVDADAIFTSKLPLTPVLKQLSKYTFIVVGSTEPLCLSDGIVMDETYWSTFYRNVGMKSHFHINAGTFFLKSSPLAAELLFSWYGRPFGVVISPKETENLHHTHPLLDNWVMQTMLVAVGRFSDFREKIGFAVKGSLNCMASDWHPGCMMLHASGKTLLASHGDDEVAPSGKIERLEQLLRICGKEFSRGPAANEAWPQSYCRQRMCSWSFYNCSARYVGMQRC